MSMIDRIEEVISELKRLQRVLEDELPALDIKWLCNVMSHLRPEHPVFHSEADFKEYLHSQLSIEGLDVHIEHPFDPHKIDKSSVQRKSSGARNALDIWLPDKGVAIELKYRKQALEGFWKSELFQLRPGGAIDQTRYDVLEDVKRLEDLNLTGYRIGFVVLLTNDPLLWKPLPPKTKSETFDEQFRLHDIGRSQKITGPLQWQCKTINGQKKCPSKGTMGEDRNKPIFLSGSYFPKWRNYSDLANETEWNTSPSRNLKYGKFRYLALEVKPQRKGAPT